MRFYCCLAVLVFAGCSSDKPTDSVQVAPGVSTTPSDATTPALSSIDTSTTETEDHEFVIDVRSQSEWDSGHVASAVHIPHTEIAQRISEVTDDKNAKIVVYCRAGGRAGTAKEALENLGFSNVENAGGYEDVKSRFE